MEVTTSLYARDSLVGGFGKGIVISMLSIGFLAIWIFDSNRGFLYPGFILLGLGAGFFISTLIAMRLTRNYSLTDGAARELPADGRL